MVISSSSPGKTDLLSYFSSQQLPLSIIYCLLAHSSPPPESECSKFICLVHWCFPVPRRMSSTRQSLSKNTVNYKRMQATHITSSVLLSGRNSVGGVRISLLLFPLHCVPRSAKNILLLTHVLTPPYDHVDTRTHCKSFKNNFYLPRFWDVTIHEIQLWSNVPIMWNSAWKVLHREKPLASWR